VTIHVLGIRHDIIAEAICCYLAALTKNSFDQTLSIVAPTTFDSAAAAQFV